MGTRNLTMVINKVGKTKIAQYGQWDGYPEGQGTTILEFLRGKGNQEKLQEGLERVRFGTEEDEKKLKKFLKSIGVEDGWMNGEQAAKYHEAYPYLSRDIGGEILEMVANATDKDDVMLTDSTKFGDDGLYCEWAYVVDFKKEKLEVYIGGGLNRKADKSYSLKKLPRPETFVKYFKKLEEKENW